MKKIIIGVVIFIIGTFLVLNLTNNKNVKKVDLLDPENFLIIGHRGASVEAPEHSIEAYQLSKELGADYIEIDLQMTKDNVLIAFHDENVDRTTNGTGEVANMDLAAIKRLDAGTWFNLMYPEKARESYKDLEVLTLEEIFQEFGTSVNYYIETKNTDNYSGMEDELMSLLSKYNLLDDSIQKGKVVIQSFSEESLKKIHKMDEDIPLIKLEKDKDILNAERDRLLSISEYAVGVGASYQEVDEEYISAASDAGLLIHLFTVNNLEDIQVLYSIGATGVFSDNLKPIIPAVKKFR